MIKEIATFIINLALGPPWVRDTNCFTGHVPPEENIAGDPVPNRYLAILENAGGALLMDIGGVVTATPPSTNWPEYAEKAIQLLNRAENYFEASDDAKELFDALDNTAGWKLPDPAGGASQYIACVVNAIAPPAPVENPGESGLFIFSTNYIWKIEKATCGA